MSELFTFVVIILIKQPKIDTFNTFSKMIFIIFLNISA